MPATDEVLGTVVYRWQYQKSGDVYLAGWYADTAIRVDVLYMKDYRVRGLVLYFRISHHTPIEF
jgi:hypothetical protein